MAIEPTDGHAEGVIAAVEGSWKLCHRHAHRDARTHLPKPVIQLPDVDGVIVFHAVGDPRQAGGCAAGSGKAGAGVGQGKGGVTSLQCCLVYGSDPGGSIGRGRDAIAAMGKDCGRVRQLHPGSPLRSWPECRTSPR